MRRALTFVLAMAGPAAAQDLPALHDVQGLEAGEVLNVRAGPNAQSEVVARIAADDTGIEVVRRSGNWGLVNAADGTGWVYMDYMARRPGDDWSAGTGALRCFGTTPFWTMTLRPAQGDVRREEPGLPAQTLALGAVSGANGQLAASFGDAAQGGDLTLAAGACSDGLSDRSFAITVTGRLRPGLGGATGEAALGGCCSVEP